MLFNCFLFCALCFAALLLPLKGTDTIAVWTCIIGAVGCLIGAWLTKDLK